MVVHRRQWTGRGWFAAGAVARCQLLEDNQHRSLRVPGYGVQVSGGPVLAKSSHCQRLKANVQWPKWRVVFFVVLGAHVLLPFISFEMKN